MDKKVYIIAIAVIVLAGIVFFSQNDRSSNPNLENNSVKSTNSISENNSEKESDSNSEDNSTGKNIILFYSKRCSHCVVVEKFIEENQIDEKISFDKKEVGDSANHAEWMQKAKECGLTSKIGIPFLWNDGTCIMGDKPIIDFFKQNIDQ